MVLKLVLCLGLSGRIKVYLQHTVLCFLIVCIHMQKHVCVCVCVGGGGVGGVVGVLSLVNHLGLYQG